MFYLTNIGFIVITDYKHISSNGIFDCLEGVKIWLSGTLEENPKAKKLWSAFKIAVNPNAVEFSRCIHNGRPTHSPACNYLWVGAWENYTLPLPSSGNKSGLWHKSTQSQMVPYILWFPSILYNVETLCMEPECDLAMFFGLGKNGSYVPRSTTEHSILIDFYFF